MIGITFSAQAQTDTPKVGQKKEEGSEKPAVIPTPDTHGILEILLTNNLMNFQFL